MSLPENSPVVLDACVLANNTVCDLLLRLAEHPQLYAPKWSEEILAETDRTHETKLNWPTTDAQFWHHEVARSFPEAMVGDSRFLIPGLGNDLKDRHGSKTIVTFNLKHFKAADLPAGMEAVHPGDFLITLYDAAPGRVVGSLVSMAEKRKISLEDLLKKLSKSLGSFTSHISGSLNE